MSTQPIVPSEPQQPAQQMSESQAFAMPMEELKQAAFSQSEPVQQQTAQPTAQPTPGEKYSIATDANGVTLTLAPEYGGEVYKGKDFSEALGKLAGSKADANVYIKQLRGNSPAQPTIDPNAMPDFSSMSPEQEAAANREVGDFLRSLVLTPEAKNQIVSEALGVDPRFLPQTVQQITESHGRFQQETTLADFCLACPDYSDTPENSAAVANLIPDDFMQRTGRLPNADELATAWALACYRGTGTRHDPQAQQRTARPPVMPSAGATPAGNADQGAWTMPLSDLKKAAGLG